MLTIAVDPGLATGVAEWNEDQAEQPRFQSMEMDPVEVYMYLYALLDKQRQLGRKTQLVCESFLITAATAKNTQAPWSLELIGVCRFLTWLFGLPPLVLQTPAMGKSFGTDAKLKSLGWYKGTKGGLAGHADDAARHLVTFGATRGKFFNTQTLVALAELA